MMRLIRLFTIALMVTAVSQFGDVVANGQGCNIGTVALTILGIQIFIAMCEYRQGRVTPLFVTFS